MHACQRAVSYKTRAPARARLQRQAHRRRQRTPHKTSIRGARAGLLMHGHALVAVRTRPQSASIAVGAAVTVVTRPAASHHGVCHGEVVKLHAVVDVHCVHRLIVQGHQTRGRAELWRGRAVSTMQRRHACLVVVVVAMMPSRLTSDATLNHHRAGAADYMQAAESASNAFCRCRRYERTVWPIEDVAPAAACCIRCSAS